ncbi:hypothetical protein WKI45_04940 [Delftia tsuruhatensis]
MIDTVLVVIILCGLWIISMNWYVFYIGFIRKRKSPSWIPLLGGVFLFFGLYFFLDKGRENMAWIAFFIDWGSVPGLFLNFARKKWFSKNSTLKRVSIIPYLENSLNN